MNCRRRGHRPGGSKQVNKDPSREGNATSKYEDKHGMERSPMPQSPKQKRGIVAEWGK